MEIYGASAPANNAPAVSLTAPANNATFTEGDNITISANATDSDGSISKVEFYRGSTKLGEDLTSPFSYSWTTATAGTYTISAKATDNDGAATTSSTRSITVNTPANNAPTVSLTAPANNATFTEGNNITISANATDSDGSISKVEFYRGSTKLGEDLTSPFSYSWTTATAGTYTISAKATDNDGAATTSSTRSITVNTAPPTGGGTNLALNKTVTGFSQAENGNPATNINDGSNSNRWAADGFPQWVEIDLGSVQSIDELKMIPFSNRAYQFTLEGKTTSGGSYTSILNATNNTSGGSLITKTFTAKQARYVKLTITGASGYSGSWATIHELELYGNGGGTPANTAPTVSLTAPAHNATFSAGQDITITANAADTDGTIAKVEFYRGSTKIGTDNTAPYSFTWTSVPQGSFNLTAKATDNDGAATTSSVRSITVNAPAQIVEVLFDEDFNNGIPSGWKLYKPTTSHHWQLWSSAQGEGINGSACLHTKKAITGDYFASVDVTLEAGVEYIFTYNVKMPQGTGQRTIYTGYNTAQVNDTNTVQLSKNPVLTDTYTQLPFLPVSTKFTVPATGTYNMIVWSTGGGYKHMYVDDVSLQRAVYPTASVTAPVAGTIQTEGTATSITVSANASDLDGSVSEVIFFANGEEIGRDETAPYSITWTNVLPAEYDLTVQVTDDQNLTTMSAPSAYKVTFNDGSLPEYIHYSFNDGWQGWEKPTDYNLAYKHEGDGGYNNTGKIYMQSDNATRFMNSPKLYLFAGETYTAQFRSDARSSNKNQILAINTVKSRTGSTVLINHPANTSDDYLLLSTNFTVPANGGYYLLAHTLQSGSVKQYMDEIRLIGNINIGPQVALSYPAANFKMAEGASMTITADAFDSDGTVDNVKFYVNGSLVSTDNTAPYSTNWTATTAGTFEIEAIATDADAGQGSSQKITVTVDENRLQASSYLGGSGDGDAVRGAVIQADGKIVLAANIGNKTFSGATTTNLNGATSSTSGAIVRLSADGQTVLSVTRLAAEVSDISTDNSGNLYVACVGDGLIKLNSTATLLSWKKTVSGKFAQRVDAGPSGRTAALFTTAHDIDEAKQGGGEVRVYTSTGSQTGSYSASGQYTNDICIDEASQTVIVLGYKNVTTNDGDDNHFPVDIPWYKGYSYTGTLKYKGYDWAADDQDPRWHNRADNNMADSRGARCDIGEDGKLYMVFETDGGNHPFRYLPFDNLAPASIVGGDNYSEFFNTDTEPKIFVARYEPADGNYVLGQQITNRLSNGAGNTIRTRTEP